MTKITNKNDIPAMLCHGVPKLQKEKSEKVLLLDRSRRPMFTVYLPGRAQDNTHPRENIFWTIFSKNRGDIFLHPTKWRCREDIVEIFFFTLHASLGVCTLLLVGNRHMPL